jgi:aryl-alcohol dehydrogenase-like predicted oxidoreductase
MEYARLGDSGIEVSKLCVGCMSFGDPASNMHAWTLDASESETIISHALELGINFFDTANCYSAGTSEEYLGKAIRNTISREKVVIATKVYFNEGNLSKEAIPRELDGSLKRLGMDYVDLLIIHRFDYNTPVEKTMEALHKVVQSGKVRAIGASAMYGYQFSKLQDVAEKNGWTKFVSMQDHYNLLYREDERELIPICKEQGVVLTPYSPLAAGRLARPWSTDTLRSQTDVVAAGKYDKTKDSDVEIVNRVSQLAEKHNCTMTQIALAWHFAKGVTSPLIGATKAKYFDDAAGSFDITLSKEDIEYLEEMYIAHQVVGAL